MSKSDLKPIVKWVGGKTQLLDKIIPLIDQECSTYVEPFFGGGAILLSLRPNKAIINDVNEELINLYLCVKESPDELIKNLKSLQEEHSEEFYYKIRELDRKTEYINLSDIQRAARILYLNKTCYNGLFRVNSAGQFNTPFGKYKKPKIVNENEIIALSRYLNENKIKIMCGDYKNSLKYLRKNSFVYFDPPYMPVSKSSDFTSYTENGFNYDKQIELRNECLKLHKKGIKFLQSNSYCKEIIDLYSNIEGITIEVVEATRSINSISSKRGKIREVLIYNVN